MLMNLPVMIKFQILISVTWMHHLWAETPPSSQVQGDDPRGHLGQWFHEEPRTIPDPWDRGLHVPCGIRQRRLHHRGRWCGLAGLRHGRWVVVTWPGPFSMSSHTSQLIHITKFERLLPEATLDRCPHGNITREHGHHGEPLTTS